MADYSTKIIVWSTIGMLVAGPVDASGKISELAGDFADGASKFITAPSSGTVAIDSGLPPITYPGEIEEREVRYASVGFTGPTGPTSGFGWSATGY